MTSASECRIPMALQNVFLESNQGKEVNKPPPEKFANKSYHPDQQKRYRAPKFFGMASIFGGSTKKKTPVVHLKQNVSPRKKVKVRVSAYYSWMKCSS